MVKVSFRATLFYDGHCSICKKVKAFIEWADRRQKIQMVDLWTTSVDSQYSHLNINNLIKEIHLQTDDGKIHTGYFAFRYIASVIPLFFPFWIISLLPGMSFLGTRAYAFISKNRYLFGCETCGKLYCRLHSVPIS